jgi:hypothetical protein
MTVALGGLTVSVTPFGAWPPAPPDALLAPPEELVPLPPEELLPEELALLLPEELVLVPAALAPPPPAVEEAPVFVDATAPGDESPLQPL